MEQLSLLFFFVLYPTSILFGQSNNSFNEDSDLSCYITKNYVLGKFDYTSHSEFEKTPFKNSGKFIYLNKLTYEAFRKMFNAALEDGVELKIISGTRNFAHQKQIWERKWNKNENKNLTEMERAMKILRFSSMPGSSRHHWGTDIDLNNWENSYFETGEGKKIYDWLVHNANAYGFYQVYTSKEKGRTGYSEEKWHWSYFPVAEKCLKKYNSVVNNNDIEGFKGSHLAMEIQIIKDYVNGIEK